MLPGHVDQPLIVQKVVDLYETYGKSVKIPRSGWWAFWEAPGWLWIFKEREHYHVQWATGKTTHFSPCKSYGVDICFKTGKRHSVYKLTGAWHSALSMWPIYGESSADCVYNYIVDLVEKTHDVRMEKAA